ncbi:MAG: hypothetical protein R3250_13450 [Melioribacteraceae bacterium]|nr:hypothetical protein [Melioribacteraceae bacterium]
MSWLFTDDPEEYEPFCFSIERFNTKGTINVKNYFKIYSSGLIIVVYLLIFMILWYYNNGISITDYLYGIYQSYQNMVTYLLSLITSNGDMISFLANILSSTYVIYQLYMLYSSTETSITHYKKFRGFKENFSNVRRFIDDVIDIYKNDIFLFNEKLLIEPYIKEIDTTFSKKKIASIGSSVLLKKQIAEHEQKFNSILQYIGLLDSFISITRLVKMGYSFPQFDYVSEKPYINAIGNWGPYLPPNQVPNNCELQEPNTMIITGPNTSGKSTYIRNIMVAVLLAQTLGVTCCKNLRMTPFYYLFTYIDIPNIARFKESLFEAEINRCIEYCNLVDNLPKDKFVFTIMDEIFTGTNPKEGVGGSYAVCEYLGNFENNLLIITTHFNKLTELGEKHPDKFKNMKFTVEEMEDGSYSRSYKITEGISDQNIAIDLLRQKGYNEKIIKRMKKLIK